MSATPKAHKWEREEIDSGPLGVNEFWTCHACGAAGGPVWYDEDPPVKKGNWTFLAGAPIHISPDDCDLAKKQIEDYVAQRVKQEAEAKAKLMSSLNLKDDRKNQARLSFADRVIDKIVRDLLRTKVSNEDVAQTLLDLQEKWKNMVIVELLNEDEYI